MFTNQITYSQFEIDRQTAYKQEKQNELSSGCLNSVSIWLNNKPINFCLLRLGEDFARRMVGYFWDNLQKTIIYGQKFDNMSAQEWIDFQENRLKIKLSGNFELKFKGKTIDSFYIA
jgi:hypothetical protein